MTSHPSTSFQVPADPASAAAAAPTQTSTSTSAGPQSEGSRSSSSAEHSKEQEQDHDQVWSSESSMSYAGTPPTSVDLGIKSRLPTEIFVSAAAHLGPSDLISATQVCQTWRRALCAAAHLWTSCLIFVDSDYAVDRLKTWCHRANRSLRHLHLVLPSSPAGYPLDWLMRRLFDLRSALLHFDGGAQVSTVRLQVLDSHIHAVAAVGCLCDVFLRPEPSTRYLSNSHVPVTCDLRVPWPYFPVDKGFLHFFGSVDEVRVFCRPSINNSQFPNRMMLDDVTERFFAIQSQAQAQRPVMDTTQLQLFCAVIPPTASVPLFANLCELTLWACSLGRHFYHLLASAAPRLECLDATDVSLWAVDLQQLPPEVFDQPPVVQTDRDEEDLDEWDPARPRVCSIVLPNLRQLRCRGPRTPAWWQSDARLTPNAPDVYMPSLQCASLCDMSALDEIADPHQTASPRRTRALEFQLQEGELPDTEDEELLLQGIVPLPALWNMTSVTRNLRSLDLSGSTVSDATLVDAFRFASQLEVLVMRDMPELTDWAARALLALTHLRLLDIRGTAIAAHMVARVYEHIRDVSGLGVRLERVYMDDPGPFWDTESGYWAHVAYVWMEWIGLVVDWQSDDRAKAEMKRPWPSRQQSESELLELMEDTSEEEELS